MATALSCGHWCRRQGPVMPASSVPRNCHQDAESTLSMRVQGACGTCASSTATMKMGIERALRVVHICAVQGCSPGPVAAVCCTLPNSVLAASWRPPGNWTPVRSWVTTLPRHPVLQSAFGEALKGVQQVGAQDTSATLASVDAHLDMLRPAISNYGGSIVVRLQPYTLNLLRTITTQLDMLRSTSCED